MVTYHVYGFNFILVELYYILFYYVATVWFISAIRLQYVLHDSSLDMSY